MNINGLDAIDNQILTLLKDNGRLTYSEIGEKVGLTRTGVKKRIDALEENGVIMGYQAKINPLALPETMTFYAYIETKPEMYDITIRKLKEEPCVTYLFETVGNNALFMICNSKNKDARSAFRWKVNQTYEGITYFSVKDIWKVDKGVILPE